MMTSLFSRQCLPRLPRPRAAQYSRARIYPGAPHTYGHLAPAEATRPTLPASPYILYQAATGQVDHQQHDHERSWILRDRPERKLSSGPEAQQSWNVDDQTSITDNSSSVRDCKIKKFVPVLRKSKTRQSLAAAESAGKSATGGVDIRGKIFAAKGDYRRIQWDLKISYGLSITETHQTISQLERLLWGLGPASTSLRIQRFHEWKLKFSYLMTTIGHHPARFNELHGAEIKRMVLLAAQNRSAFESLWRRLQENRQALLWPQVIDCAMSSQPEVLPGIVRMTFDPSFCPNYIIEDIIHFLDRIISHPKPSSKSQPHPVRTPSKRSIDLLLDFLVQHAPFRYIQLGQSSLRHIVARKPPHQLWVYYEWSREKGQYWAPNTLLHVASKFAHSPTHKVHAMQVFSHLATLPDFDINTPECASVCTTLLSIQKDGPLPQGQADPDTMFKFLLDLGFNPNLLGWSALMHNFCIRGHLDTGWKVFDMLTQHGYQPDGPALSILMNRSKIDMNVGSARNVLRVALATKNWSPALLNDFLTTLYISSEHQQDKGRRQHKINSAWRPMVQLYSKFFKLEPLQKITLFPLENIIASHGPTHGRNTELTDTAASIPPLRDSELMQPNSTTLVILFAAHMRSISNPMALRSYYRHIRRLIAKRDPTVSQMFKDSGTRMYDIFVQGFMQFTDTVGLALEIVFRMLRRGRMQVRDGRRLWMYRAPSVYTWTMLMHGFRNRRRGPQNSNRIDGSFDAVRILDIMTRVAGEQPSVATWNVLLAAFARHRHVQAAIKAISCMQAAGHPTGEDTLQMLGYFNRKDRELLVQLLESGRQQMAADASIRLFGQQKKDSNRVANIAGIAQEPEVTSLIETVLPKGELAEISGQSPSTQGLTGMQYAQRVFVRMQQRWARYAQETRVRRRMNWKHKRWLARARARAELRRHKKSATLTVAH